MRTGLARTLLDEPPVFQYEVETDEDDIGLLHTSLVAQGFCGVVHKDGKTYLNYSAPLSKTKETQVRKKVKDHKEKRLVPANP